MSIFKAVDEVNELMKRVPYPVDPVKRFALSPRVLETVSSTYLLPLPNPLLYAVATKNISLSEILPRKSYYSLNDDVTSK